MNIKEFIEKYNIDLLHRKTIGVLKDNNNNLQFAIIISDYSSNMEIHTYNELCI